MSLRDALAALYSAYDATQLAERHAAAAKLISEEQRRRVRRAGDHIPPFDIHDPDQGHIYSIDVMKKGPLIATFYRGLWCSYCQRDLLGVEKLMPDIQKVGATVIAITHGLTERCSRHVQSDGKNQFPDHRRRRRPHRRTIRPTVERQRRRLDRCRNGNRPRIVSRYAPLDSAHAGSLFDSARSHRRVCEYRL